MIRTTLLHAVECKRPGAIQIPPEQTPDVAWQLWQCPSCGVIATSPHIAR